MSDPKIGGSGRNESTTPPVYLRAQKRSASESSRSGLPRGRTRLNALSIGLLSLVLVACALWLLARYVDTDPRFRLHQIDMTGNQFASRDAVEAVFADDRGASVYRIPLEDRRRELEQIPWVRSASVTRVLPDCVAISVEEREPVAFLWTRHGIELMDRDGVILESPAEVTWTFPVLRGIPERESAAERKVRMELYLQFMDGLRQQEDGDPAEISEVDLSDPANLSIVVTNQTGALRLHLGKEELLERYAIYRAHIAEWRQQFNEIRSIDLRFEGQAVIQSGSPFTVNVGPDSESQAAPATGAAVSFESQRVLAAIPMRNTP
jgi:cell division protein FtsQ